MISLEKQLFPNRDAFNGDPFGYSTAAWLKWGAASTFAGFPIDRGLAGRP